MTRRIILFFLSMILCLKLSAQTELIEQKLKNYYNVLQPEYIDAFLSKTHLQRGENLFFQLWLRSTSRTYHNLSAIVYAELLNTDSTVIARQKLSVSEGSANGAFEIPPGIPEGAYIFKAYTLWMKNGNDFTFRQPFYVGPLSSDETLTQSLRETRLHVSQNGNFIQVRVDDAIDGHLLVHQQGEIVYRASKLKTMRQDDVFEIQEHRGPIAIGLFDQLGNLVDEVSYAFSSSLPVRIDLSKEVYNRREKVVVSVDTNDEEFKRVSMVVLPAGEQLRTLPANYCGTAKWSDVLDSSPQRTFAREIFIYPPMEQSLPPIEPQKEKESLQEVSVLATIRKHYNLEHGLPRKANVELPSDNSYVISNYLALPSLEEFLREVVPEARVKKMKDSRAIFLRNIENPNRIFFYEKSPLLLVDNQIINDQREFLSIDPATLERLNVSWRTETINATGINSLANAGILSAFRKQTLAANKPDIYDGFAKPIDWGLQASSLPADPLDELPDFRQTMHWSCHELFSNSKVTFTLSDDTGNYMIEFLGYDAGGRMFRGTKAFKVEF